MLFPDSEISRAFLDVIGGLHFFIVLLFVQGLEKLLGVGEHESRMMAIPGWPLAPWDSVTIRCNAEQPVLGTKAEEREHMTFFYNLLLLQLTVKGF